MVLLQFLFRKKIIVNQYFGYVETFIFYPDLNLSSLEIISHITLKHGVMYCIYLFMYLCLLLLSVGTVTKTKQDTRRCAFFRNLSVKSVIFSTESCTFISFCFVSASLLLTPAATPVPRTLCHRPFSAF